MLFTFTISCYYSCKKDPCHGVTCANGGVCSGGACKCPTGYSGTLCQTKDPSTIAYQNNTFTPVNITINGTASVIPAGSSVLYLGYPGGSASGSASTYGVSSSGAQAGLSLSWSFSDLFPAANTTLTKNIDVPASYFYFSVINNSTYYITQELINYMQPIQVSDTTTIYNMYGRVHNLGYFLANSSTVIYLATTNPVVNYYAIPTLPLTANQSYTFTAN